MATQEGHTDRPGADVQTVHRKKARSGAVDYSDAVVLVDNSRTRVTLVPFFIKHNAGRTGLSVKITTYRKKPPPDEWAVVEEKSLSLNESATQKLNKALKDNFALAGEDHQGRYLLIPLDEGQADLHGHDPKTIAGALTKILSQEDIAEHLQDLELTDELASAMRGAIRLREMQSAVAQLREHLNNGENDEDVYQTWCEQHTWAFGNAYVMRDNVRQISTGDQLDILLPTVIAGYRDIVELKRPDMKVLNYDSDHRNYYFTSEVSKTIGQCHRYLDVLHEEAGKGLRDHPEIVAYHPRAIMVIGRSNDWTEEKHKALHGLNRRLSGIKIMTYDQLLAQGERLVEMLSHQPGEDATPTPDVFDDFDDDIPF